MGTVPTTSSARRALRLLPALVLAAATAAAPGAASPSRTMFPFVKGAAWTYAATLRYTVVNSNHVKTANVCWRSEVVDAFDRGDAAGALLKGFVFDLPWWSPRKPPGDYAVVRLGPAYYVFHDDAKKGFAAVRLGGRAGLPVQAEETPWFQLPLRKGAVLRSRERTLLHDDTRYGWLVESVSPNRLSFLSLSGQETMTLSPGIGITSYTYVHNGTVAEAHVHLVSFRPGDAADTAFRQPASCAFRSTASRVGVNRAPARHVAASASTPGQNPDCSPASAAAPSAVVSRHAGRSTGTPSRSAWRCMTRSFADAPPSTRSSARRMPASSSIAATTSAV
jgi:hypothetical protein